MFLPADPVDTGRKLNVHKTFGRRPGRLLNILCTFNLRPVSTGDQESLTIKILRANLLTMAGSTVLMVFISS